MDTKMQLKQLYAQHEPDLAAYAWASETDRWAELIYCCLLQCSQQGPEITRAALAALKSLSLLEIDRLVSLDISTCESSVVFAYVLKQYGFSEQDAKKASHLLANVARTTKEKYKGKIQIFLRRYGCIMRDELVGAFKCEGLTEPQLSYAVTHWLQNVLGLPISLQHPAVLGFCEKNGIGLEDLWKAVDDLDMNMALVDDSLEMVAASQQSEGISVEQQEA